MQRAMSWMSSCMEDPGEPLKGECDPKTILFGLPVNAPN
jgi:hypothetical protein